MDKQACTTPCTVLNAPFPRCAAATGPVSWPRSPREHPARRPASQRQGSEPRQTHPLLCACSRRTLYTTTCTHTRIHTRTHTDTHTQARVESKEVTKGEGRRGGGLPRSTYAWESCSPHLPWMRGTQQCPHEPLPPRRGSQWRVRPLHRPWTTLRPARSRPRLPPTTHHPLDGPTTAQLWKERGGRGGRGSDNTERGTGKRLATTS